MNRNRFGGIVVDTLVVVAIIALLAIIAVPVYNNRDKAAKINRATDEVLALAQAESEVARLYGFYVPLQVLDDLPIKPATRTQRTDDLGNEPDSIRLIDAANPQASQLSLKSDDPRVKNLIENWHGPFLESKRVHMATTDSSFDPDKVSGSSMARDYPLDPWGNPYRFYSPVGIIGSKAMDASALDSDTFSDGVVGATDDRFETFAIVSFGPDGKSSTQSSDPEKENDDIIYLFERPAAHGS